MTEKSAPGDTIQPDDCWFQDEDGAYTLAIRVMPEQLVKFKAWANHVGVPLDQFMREGAGYLCTQLAENLAIAQHEQAVDDAALSDDNLVVLH